MATRRARGTVAGWVGDRGQLVSTRPSEKARPVAIALERVGHGAGRRLLVLVHGVLSDRRVWRFAVGDLGHDHDLLLVDLPGCGSCRRARMPCRSSGPGTAPIGCTASSRLAGRLPATAELPGIPAGPFSGGAAAGR